MSNICSFRGEYGYLSNFYPSMIANGQLSYATAEHMFQARKTLDIKWRRKIAAAQSPAEAKKLGREVPLRYNWEYLKFEVMQDVVSLKFHENPALTEKLAATGVSLLVEGNKHHDQTWGDCTCPQHANIPGRNALGIILMRVRLEMQ